MTVAARARRGGRIAGLHLEALERLGRTELVGIVSRTTGAAQPSPRAGAGRAYADLERMLDDRPDVVYVACRRSVRWPSANGWWSGGIPFLTEKPLAAAMPRGRPGWRPRSSGPGSWSPSATTFARSTSCPRSANDSPAPRPPGRGALAGATPGPAWWGLADQGGGQVVEQATHLFDLARVSRSGEAEVVGAASAGIPGRGSDLTWPTRRRPCCASHGAVGAFANTRRLASPRRVELASDGLLTVLTKGRARPGRLADVRRRRRPQSSCPGTRPVRDPGRRPSSTPWRPATRARPVDLRGRAPDGPPDPGGGGGDRRAG